MKKVAHDVIRGFLNLWLSEKPTFTPDSIHYYLGPMNPFLNHVVAYHKFLLFLKAHGFPTKLVTYGGMTEKSTFIEIFSTWQGSLFQKLHPYFTPCLNPFNPQFFYDPNNIERPYAVVVKDFYSSVTLTTETLEQAVLSAIAMKSSIFWCDTVEEEFIGKTKLSEVIPHFEYVANHHWQKSFDLAYDFFGNRRGASYELWDCNLLKLFPLDEMFKRCVKHLLQHS